MAAPTFIQRYDAKTNIVDVSFPKVHLESRDEIRAHFDRVLAFWREQCGGRKVYYVVNYDGFSVNLRENDLYAEQMRRSNSARSPSSVTVVIRCSGPRRGSTT
jgi:hypothetical protein